MLALALPNTAKSRSPSSMLQPHMWSVDIRSSQMNPRHLGQAIPSLHVVEASGPLQSQNSFQRPLREAEKPGLQLHI